MSFRSTSDPVFTGPSALPAPWAVMQQRLWIPGRLPGLNEMLKDARSIRRRASAYSLKKRKLTNDIALLASRLQPVARARFTFAWHEENRKRNPDNIAAGHKFILDGLVKAGVLENDGWLQVAGWTDTFHVSNRVGVWLLIEPDATAV